MSAIGCYSRTPSLADVLAWVGNVPNHRVRCWPPAGRSTPEDLDALNAEETVRYELVAGVAVQRAGGTDHLCLRNQFAGFLTNSLLGISSVRIAIGERFQLDRCLVRFPDLALVTSKGNRVLTLVVEVWHSENTAREMEIELIEFARSGVKLAWYVDPERKEVDVYPKGNPKRKKTLTVNDALDGGDVLPGFSVQVARIFESRAPKKTGRKGKK